MTSARSWSTWRRRTRWREGSSSMDIGDSETEGSRESPESLSGDPDSNRGLGERPHRAHRRRRCRQTYRADQRLSTSIAPDIDARQRVRPLGVEDEGLYGQPVDVCVDTARERADLPA